MIISESRRYLLIKYPLCPSSIRTPFLPHVLFHIIDRSQLRMVPIAPAPFCFIKGFQETFPFQLFPGGLRNKKASSFLSCNFVNFFQYLMRKNEMGFYFHKDLPSIEPNLFHIKYT